MSSMSMVETLSYPNSFFSTHSNFPFSSKRNIRLCVCGEGAGGELCWRGEGESGGG